MGVEKGWFVLVDEVVGAACGIEVAKNLNGKLWDDKPHPGRGMAGEGARPTGLREKWELLGQLPVLGSQFSVVRAETCDGSAGGIRIGKNLGCKLWDDELRPRGAEWRERAVRLHVFGASGNCWVSCRFLVLSSQ